MSEAGSGRAGMAPRRSFPRARRTERRHRSMSGRGSAGKTRKERENLSKVQEGSRTDETTLTACPGLALNRGDFNKQIINKCNFRF